jgi:hypothetical protein
MAKIGISFERADGNDATAFREAPFDEADMPMDAVGIGPSEKRAFPLQKILRIET